MSPTAGPPLHPGPPLPQRTVVAGLGKVSRHYAKAVAKHEASRQPVIDVVMTMRDKGTTMAAMIRTAPRLKAIPFRGITNYKFINNASMDKVVAALDARDKARDARARAHELLVETVTAAHVEYGMTFRAIAAAANIGLALTQQLISKGKTGVWATRRIRSK